MKYFYALFCFVVLGLISCSEHPQKIRIGYNTWAGYEAVAIANKKGFFKAAGLDVTIQQYNTLDDVKQAFADNRIDVMFSTSNEVILLAEKHKDPKIVLVADYSNGSDALVAHNDIHTLQDLKGKKVGVELGSVSHFILLKALQSAHMSEKDIYLVDVNNAQAQSQFANQTLDAITTWSPYTLKALKAGGHVIFSSSEIPKQIVDVMSIRKTLIEQRSQDCQKLVNAYLNTLLWFDENHHSGIAIMARAAKMTTEEFSRSLKGIKIASFDDNVEAFGSMEKTGFLYHNTQQLIDFLLKQQVISEPLKANDLIAPQFIWDIKKTHL